MRIFCFSLCKRSKLMFGYISILLDFLLTKVNHLAKNRPMYYNIHTDLNRVLHYDEHKFVMKVQY